jgi:protein phosphatase 1 regulatory subunit 7
LSNLKIISIQSNRLTEITGLSSLLNLEELYIADNALTQISGLESNASLRVIDISRNRIDKLVGIGHLQHLEEFWASSNQFSSFDEVEKELGDKKELATVYFEGNPLQMKNPVTYRNKIRLALPQIKQIDASEYNSSDSK